MPSHALYYAQWQFGLFMTVVTKRSLQQRDCSGLSPDSLFTHGETTIRLRTKSSAKVQTFFHLQRKNATKIETIKKVREIVQDLMKESNPSDFTQGLMELGATVCMPQVILCNQCPLNQVCHAFNNHTQMNYPIKSKKIC